MNTEEITIELVSEYKYAGFREEDTEQRKTYLAVLAFILVSKTHNNYLDETLLQGINYLCGTKNHVATLKQSHQVLVDEIKERYAQASELTEQMFGTLSPLVKNKSLHGISALNALKIYDKTLQRLQKINVEDNLSRSFQYDYFPAELAQLVVSSIDGKNQLSIYEPLSENGKLAIIFCALSDVDHAFVVAEKQSPTYVTHMLTIAGVNSSHTTQKPQKTTENFDVSVLLQPIDSDATKTLNIEKLISNQLDSLSDNGIAVAFVGHGFLTGKLHKNFRDELISKGNVKAVIELPERLLTRSTPTLFALLLRKKNSSQQITFGDLSEQFESRGRLNALVAGAVHTSEKALFVDISTVLSKGCSLAPRGYIHLNTHELSTGTNESRKKLEELQQKNDRLLRKLLG